MPVRATPPRHPKNPREILGDRYAPRDPGQRPPPITTAAGAVLAAADGVYEAFVRLLLPLLTPAVRLQMSDAALVGMPQFLRAYEQITGSATLRAALSIDERFVPDLRKKHGSLLAIEGGAAAFAQLAEDGELLCLDRIRHILDGLLGAADAVAEEGAKDPAQRLQAARLAAFVRGYRARPTDGLKARRDRAARRVARAEDRRTALLKEQSLAAARRELLGDEPAADAAPPAPRPAPRRRAAATAEAQDAALLRGAPLSRCLEAPAEGYAACAADLGARAADLGVPAISDEDRGAVGTADALVEGDLAVLCSDLLPGLPWLAVDGAAELLGLADLQAAFCRLQAALQLLQQGARDGALVCGRLALIVHEGTGAWLEQAKDGDPEARRIALVRDGAWELLQRSRDQLEGPAAAADRKIAGIDADADARLAHADYERTVSDLAGDKDVPEARIETALGYKRRLETELAAAPRRRTRPR